MGLPMLHQPQGIPRLRPEFSRFKGVGAIMGASVDDVFGSAARIVYQNEPLQASSPHGVARRFASSKSSYATITPAAGIVDFSLMQPFMIVCAFTLAVTNVATRILSYRQAAASAATTGIQLGYSTNGRLGFWVGNSTGQGSQAASNAVLVAHKPYTAVVGWDGSNYFMFLNGARQTGSSPASFVTSNNGTTADINIGRRNTGSSYLDGTVSLFAHLTGAFSLEEARLLSANPWGMFDDIDADDYRGALAAPVAPINLLGASGVQLSQGSSGAISQVQNVAGGAGAHTNIGDTGAIGQVQSLSGVAGMHANTGSVGAINQVQQVAGVSGLQDNEGEGAGVGQVQSLVGTTGQQENQGGIGGVTAVAPEPGNPAGTPGEQANVGGIGAIVQVQTLMGTGADQPNAGTVGSAGQVLNLIADPGTQSNTGGVGAVGVAVPDALEGAAGQQENIGDAGAITQVAVLAGAGGAQSNTGTVGSLVRLGLAMIYTDPGEMRIHVAVGEQRVWTVPGEQRIHTLH